MITPPKPDKLKSPVKTLRPLTLLNTIRKKLSLICLQRTRPAVTKYITSGQSGFQPNRSTADLVWSHQWLAAKCSITQELKVNITGIDMSEAFDTINRTQLQDILENIIEEDELRIVRFLLSNTKIKMKVNGATEHHSFLANTGTRLGDGLSPALFIIYLENALRDVRATPEHKDLSPEIAYADDVDFISLTGYRDVENIQAKLCPHQLNVNTDKTEYACIERKTNKSEQNWRTVKKVRSLMGEDKDIERRKAPSTITLSKLNVIWIRKYTIRKDTKLKLYKSLTKFILCGLTKHQEDQLNSFHCRQLRKIRGITYTNVFTKQKLYEMCKEIPLSISILKARWRFSATY